MISRLFPVLSFLLGATAGSAAPQEERPELAPYFADEKVIRASRRPGLNFEIKSGDDAPKRLPIGRACLKALGALK